MALPKNEINFRDLYQVLLRKFDLGPLCTDLFKHVIAGSDKADAFEEIYKNDRFFTENIVRLASVNMRTSVVSSLGHGVVVVGQQKIRDLVLGHTVSRIFSPHADNQLKEIQDAYKNTRHANAAEEAARKCRNEYTGMALAAGYMFDIFAKWISEESTYRGELEAFFDQIWKHSLRTAALAWALASHERVFITHRKNIFAAGLLHDIGKLGLALFNPKVYQTCIEKMKEAKHDHPTDDAFELEIERKYFDVAHPEVGAAMVFQTKILSEIDPEIDFHHDSILLKTRSNDSFLAAVVVSIADSIAWLSERMPDFRDTEVKIILRPHAAYFPLRAHDVMTLFAGIRARGLLP